MTALNPNATEWKPTGNNEHGMTDLALPPATALPGEMESGEASRGASAGSPPATTAAAVTATASRIPPSYIPSYMTGDDPTIAEELANINWDAEFTKLMELTGELIEMQLNGQGGDEATGAAHNLNSGPTADAAATPVASAATAGGVAGEAKPSAVPLPGTYASAVKSAAAAARKPTTLGVASTSSAAAAAAEALLVDSDDSASMAPTAPTTKTGSKHHWKRLTKAQQRQEQSQRSAFEAFANALLHSVSPFMAPLREKCKTSLPHIKVDQRFGKSGHPETAVAQFIVAPLVTNYRPRHFHDVAPGELMEFHYDFSLVLQAIPSAYAIHIGYGPIWKRYAVPYCYVACKEYRKEVLALCPEEAPNLRSEAIYEEDVVKDITDLLLRCGEGLELLGTMSILDAMRKRVDLYPLYDAFASIFQSLENYQVEVVDIRSAPSRFLLKTSRLALEAMPQPVMLDEGVAWDELPDYSRVIVQGGANLSNHNDNSSKAADNNAAVSAAANSTKGSAAMASGATSRSATAGQGKDGTMPPGKPAQAAEGSVPWQVAAPLVLSSACVLATLALAVLKRRKQ